MEGARVKEQTHSVNDAGEADTAVETVVGSGDGGGETILHETGDVEVAEEGKEEEPKQVEEYFEVEAIRSKRVHKGEVQYLIKWRGWPETDNTWEPLKNLQSISASIKAYEKSLKAGKGGKKRKGKSGGSNSQLKKKKKKQVEATNEVRGPVINSDGAGSSQEAGGEGIGGSEGDDNARTNGLLKVKPKKKSGVRGAKRRKSGIVKRYIPDETTTSNLDIVRIIMPMEVSTSTTNNGQDSLVTFSAMRSNGEEVTVDNKFLRAHNHHLLLDFYEQHITYKPEI
ncbi:hypothetical protein N665_0667s0029 [Sinapis alba]|nr:hypothetical protein N665_0667s0029 [Sinapis alba]